jgi:hypothetical protein
VNFLCRPGNRPFVDAVDFASVWFDAIATNYVAQELDLSGAEYRLLGIEEKSVAPNSIQDELEVAAAFL